MANEDDDNEDGEGEKSKGGGRLGLIIAVAVALLSLIGLAVAYFLGALDPLLESIEPTEEEVTGIEGEVQPEVGHFLHMDELTVSLSPSGGRGRFLKLKLVMELDQPTDEEIVRSLMPRVMDGFQVYLRELRIGELSGSQGIYRLREELLRRINAATSPLKVRDVLFADIQVQ